MTDPAFLPATEALAAMQAISLNGRACRAALPRETR